MQRTVTVKVKPNARKNCISEQDGILTVSVTAPATDGRANDRLIELLAVHFDLPKSRLSIKRGAASRNKVVQIS